MVYPHFRASNIIEILPRHKSGLHKVSLRKKHYRDFMTAYEGRLFLRRGGPWGKVYSVHAEHVEIFEDPDDFLKQKNHWNPQHQIQFLAMNPKGVKKALEPSKKGNRSFYALWSFGNLLVTCTIFHQPGFSTEIRKVPLLRYILEWGCDLNVAT